MRSERHAFVCHRRMPAPPFSVVPFLQSLEPMEDIALHEREFDLLLETVFDSDDVSETAPTPAAAAQTPERVRPDAREDDAPSTQTLGLFDALAPLVTDVDLQPLAAHARRVFEARNTGADGGP